MGKLIFTMVFSYIAAVASGDTFEVYTAEDLREKIAQVTDGDEIVLNPGTYLISERLEVNKNNVTLRSKAGKDETTIEGNSNILLLRVKGRNFAVNGITFKNGANAEGGAVKIDDSNVATTLKIVDCRFIGCKATRGGAIYAANEVHTDYDPRRQCGLVSGCLFVNCAVTGSNGCGGAVYGSLWIEDCVFDACSIDTDSGVGYGTSIAASSHMTVSNCVFKNQSVDNGSRGLIGRGSNVFQHECPLGSVRLLDCVISCNTIDSSDTALFFKSVVLDRCVVSNTVTSVVTEGNGGNLPSLYYDLDRTSSRITSSLFIDNRCPFKLGSVPALVNCTFAGNDGGLAYYESDKSEVAITNCVFWGNKAKTQWPWGKTYCGVPGLYWWEGKKLAEIIKLSNVVIEGGCGNDDVLAVLQADSSGKSESLTALAAEKGPGFKDSEKGDWSLRKSSVLIDGGVRYEGIDVMKDLANNPRALKSGALYPGALPDIGCYEYYSIPGLCILVR